MSTLIAGFLGPQEIIVILILLLFLFIIPFVVILGVIKKSKNKSAGQGMSARSILVDKEAEEPESAILQTNTRDLFPVKEGSKITLIPFAEIVDFSAANNYVFLTNIEGNDYLVDSNLSDLEKKLPEGFIRVHKSTIINRNLISEIKKLANGRYDLVMKCKKERVISCSKNYNEKIKSLIEF